MPWSIASTLTSMRRIPAAHGPSVRKPRRDPPGWAVATGWLVAVASILGVFLGGAGVLMVAAGHVMPTTVGLVGLGVASVVYLTWFLGPGPGRVEGTPPRVAPRRTSTGSERPTPTSTFCSCCGVAHDSRNRVRMVGDLAICERCVSAAFPDFSPYGSVRVGVARGPGVA